MRHKLIKNCKYPLLLIELGEVGSAVHPNAVLGAMAHITLDIGIPVMMTKNTLESAHFLSIAAKRKYDVFESLKKSLKETTDEDVINSKVESAKNPVAKSGPDRLASSGAAFFSEGRETPKSRIPPTSPILRRDLPPVHWAVE